LYPSVSGRIALYSVVLGWHSFGCILVVLGVIAWYWLVFCSIFLYVLVLDCTCSIVLVCVGLYRDGIGCYWVVLGCIWLVRGVSYSYSVALGRLFPTCPRDVRRPIPWRRSFTPARCRQRHRRSRPMRALVGFAAPLVHLTRLSDRVEHFVFARRASRRTCVRSSLGRGWRIRARAGPRVRTRRATRPRWTVDHTTQMADDGPRTRRPFTQRRKPTMVVVGGIELYCMVLGRIEWYWVVFGRIR
jgi:hypothetical protein